MFLSNADKRINYWETGFARRKNPWNPYDMLAEFNINIVDEGRIGSEKDILKRKFDVYTDELIALEGCENDDLIFLGGKDGFLSHFCTYFGNFSVCYQNVEQRSLNQINKFLKDENRIESTIETLIKNLDNQ